MDIDDSVNDNKRFWHAKCAEVVKTIADALVARGYKSVVQGNMITTLIDHGNGSDSSSITVYPLIERFCTKPKGVVVKVLRARHPILYRCDKRDDVRFPVDKIVKAHVGDLEARRASVLEYTLEREIREHNEILANAEVPLPADVKHWRKYNLPGFERFRDSTGAYHVRISFERFTAEEACAMRDIVLAASNREHKTNLKINETQNCTD